MSDRTVTLVEASPAGSVAVLQGSVHLLTGLVRVAEVVEDMNAGSLELM